MLPYEIPVNPIEPPLSYLVLQQDPSREAAAGRAAANQSADHRTGGSMCHPAMNSMMLK